jgi:tetratricopeptide (TPR) repeat protein
MRWCCWKPVLAFNRREFETALTLYGEAFNLAKTPIEKQEATSYQAYTLYFLKRFEEASQLFLSLSDLNPSVDSYLFQAARSAYQGRAYKRALDLYDRFVDDYPESPYFLPLSPRLPSATTILAIPPKPTGIG